MADAEKKDRKPPTPRGLTIEVSMEHTTRALQLAQSAGLSTKAEVEEALSEFLDDRYLGPFLTHLGTLAVARIQKLLPPPPAGSAAG